MAASPFALGQLFRPASVIAAPFRLIAAAIAHRRVMSQLSVLDDRMLRDIGLSRSDVTSAMAEPLFRDPTTHLVAQAAEARAAARGSMTDRGSVGGAFGTAS